MKAAYLLFFITMVVSTANAQCPKLKKTNSDNSSISVDVSIISKNTSAVLYNVENGQAFLNFDAKPTFNNNTYNFTNLPTGNYIVRINEKGCKPLFIGKEENIIVK